MKTPPVVTAAANGKAAKVRELLAQGADPNARDEAGKAAIFLAAESGHAEVVRALLDAGADPNADDGNHQSPLTQSCWMGHVQIVRLLLDAGASPEGYGHGAVTPLMFAAHEGRAEIVEALLAAGADVNARTTEGATALFRAAGQGKQAVAARLIDLGADVNARTDDGCTALHLAIRQGKMGMVRLLIDRGADVNAESQDGRTPLLEAVLHGRARVLRPFLEAKANPNTAFRSHDDFRSALSKGATPLHVAAFLGKPESARALLDAGADPAATNDRGETALDVAEGLGHAEVIDLLAAIATPSKRRAKGQNLGPRLVRSAASGKADDVRALLARGADPNARDPQPVEQGRTALIAAAREGHLDCVTALLQAGADPSLTTTENSWLGATATPLMAAAGSGHAEVVRALLDAGAKPDATNDRGETALMEAARYGQADVVRLLLAAGADPAYCPPRGGPDGDDEDDGDDEGGPADALTVALNNGQTHVLDAFFEAGAAMPPSALSACARTGDAAAVARLLDAGLDVNARGPDGATALHAACTIATTVVEHDPTIDIIEIDDNDRYLAQAAARMEACVALLLDRGADVHARDARGRTPLHAAASMETHVTYVHVKDPDGNKMHTGNEIDTAPVVARLLGRGADPNAQDEQGTTPLMLAARVQPRWGADPSGVVKALLAAGAVVNLADARGQTALFGCLDDNEPVLKLLLDAGADVNRRDSKGRTPLHRAIESASDRIATVRALIAAGAEVNARDADGQTALDIAREYRSKKAIKLLQGSGAEAEPPQHRKLYEAVGQGKIQKVREALEAGADPHRPTYQWDAFGLAVSLGNAEIVRALIAAGADVNRRYGSPPDGHALFVAIESGRKDLIPILLEAGADPRVRNRKGWSALTYAACLRDAELIALLESAGAEPDPLSADFLAVMAMGAHASTPAYAEAVQLLKDATGEAPKEIGWLPGAGAFFVTAEAETEAAMRRADSPAVSKFGVEWNVLDAKVQALLEEQRPRLLERGAFVLSMGRPIGCGPSGKFVVLLPTTDKFTALAACGPAPGGDYGDGGLGLPDVVAWFRELETTHPFTLWGAGRDFVDVAFDGPVEDSDALAERIYRFCPDSVAQGAGTKAKLAKQLREQRRLYFWWD